MKKNRIGQKEIIHFIGIGVGMSGLAQVMKLGLTIQGSDHNKNKSTTNCSKQVSEFPRSSKKNIRNATIIVRSST